MPAATLVAGAGDIAEAKPNLYLTLNVRILSQAEEMGVDILTICNVCTLNLRRANKMVKDPARLLEQVNEELVKAGACSYEGTKEVTHLLWYLATEEGLALLEAQGPRGVLNGLRVAPYYGCRQLLRPSSVMGFEDPDKPQSLERLITAPGPGRGGRLRGRPSRSAAASRSSWPASRWLWSCTSPSRSRGTPAQTAWSPRARSATWRWTPTSARPRPANATEPPPVLHLPQLIGLALGIDTKVMDFKRHLVPVDRVLATVGA